MKTDNNKYQKWYDQLISRARNRTIEGYVERHHIVPRSLGGTDEESNLVALTAREHLIAHMLLVKFVENKAPMWNAVYLMMNTQGRKLTGRLYEQAKLECRTFISAALKGRPNPKISAALKGRKFSPEREAKRITTRNTNRIAKQAAGIDYPLKGRPNPKISAALKGRKLSPETCAKISAARKGTKFSPETIAKRQATRAANRALKTLQYSSERHHQSPVQLS